MPRPRQTAAAGLAFVFLVAAGLGLEAQNFDNPLILQRADPYILLHSDGYYYFCATVPEYDRIELRRARDIAGLREAKPVVVWRKQRSLLGEDRNLWAPELHRIDGKWYIYYAAGTSAAPYDVRIRVIENASSDPLSGTWTDLGRLDTGRNSLCLDATSF
ncbi:MAG TPA: family 43 glycosylhydrolase, partial [Rectinemataceae bacterium]|nr:family 43 glycosylhydrolase [Rectinemataceae bacterium]